jgi:hypothetical protein
LSISNVPIAVINTAPERPGHQFQIITEVRQGCGNDSQTHTWCLLEARNAHYRCVLFDHIPKGRTWAGRGQFQGIARSVQCSEKAHTLSCDPACWRMGKSKPAQEEHQ